MSAAPRFNAIFFVDENSVQLFYLPQKHWKEWEGEISLDKPLPKEVIGSFSESSILVLVSDTHNGHIQFTQENKKKNLDESTIFQILEDEYDIDTQAYLLGWKRFTLSREVAQVSVSGIEQELVERIAEWIAPLKSKKLWLMPFAWFVSTLKAVDPAFMAVEVDGKMHISHHYLGIDDARVLEVADVGKYLSARQKERKETHSFSVQASEKLLSKVKKQVADLEITLQPLVPDTKLAPLLAVISEAMTRGQDALAELLHFEPEMSTQAETAAEEAAAVATGEAALAADSPDSEAETEEMEETEMSDTSDASTLPPPTLPPPTPPSRVAGSRKERVQVVTEPEPELASQSEPAEEVVTEEVSETPPATPAEEPVIKEVVHPKEQVEEGVMTPPVRVVSKPEPEPEREEAPDEENDVLAHLKGTGVKSNNVERYTPMEAKKSWKGPIIVFFLVVITTALIGGGIFWSQQGAQLLGLAPQSAASPTPSPMPSPSPTPVASPVPSPSPVDKAGTSVIILNATGINGLAGRVRTQMTQAGWEEVATGNATGSYDGATFVATDLGESVVTAISEDIDRELTVSDEITEPAANNYDVVIILADE